MATASPAAVLLLAWAGCSPGPAAPRAAPADLILVGGAIATMEPGRPRAAALAVRGGAIAFVGDEAGALALRGEATRVIDLDGAMVLPGFHDAHVHPVTGGIELGQCDLNDARSVAEIRERIEAYAARFPDAPWVVGGGWSLPLFGESGPTAALLDELIGDRPAYLTASDAHSAWVNTRALAIAEITAATPDPPAGRIERDASGAPSGTLRESAMDLVSRHLPPVGHDEHVAGLRRGMARANSFGITSVLEASADAAVLAAYAELASSDELTFRVVAAQRVDLTRGPEQVAAMAARRGGPRYRPTAAKIFVDGVIEAGTAALLEPYVGRPGRGALNLGAESLSAMVAALDRAGLDVHLHAIGDRAIRRSLDAIAAARAANPPRDRRHSIAHLQLIDPADIGRFAELGVVADFQPLWAQADRYITELTEPFLGPARSRWLYPIKSVADTGAVVVAGSDWSVSSMNPLRAIQVALTRTPVDKPGQPWIAAERIDLDTALTAYTRAGAYLLRQEDSTGTLTPAKRADLVILSRDLAAIPASEIAAVKVLATLIDGTPVHCAPPMCARLGATP